MNRDEAKAMLAIISGMYPPNLMPAISSVTVDGWTMILADIDYKKAEIALMKWISVNKYPPTPADIRSLLYEQVERETPEQAWGLLQQLTLKHGYTEEEKAFEKMSEQMKEVVKRFGWKHFCQMPLNESAIYYAQFRDAFNTMALTSADRLKTNPALQARLDDIRKENLKLGANNDKVKSLPALEI